MSGRLVSPPFVDCHFHMDATLSLGLPRLNRSGTLLEGIRCGASSSRCSRDEAVVERALAYCDMAVAQGHRRHPQPCRRLRRPADWRSKRCSRSSRRVAPYLDLQLVAFPQDGLYRSPGARENLLRALDLGVDMVGGIPHFERTMDDGRRSVVELCEIAAERGLMVDMHCDETDDPHVAPHRDTWRARPSGSASPAGSPART